MPAIAIDQPELETDDEITQTDAPASPTVGADDSDTRCFTNTGCLNRDATEQVLVQTAQTAVSRCNWVVGECAARWTRKYARGRTDADFASMVGLSPDQVYQRRRVWETFGDVAGDYPALKWSHFYVAVNWDDAPECLAWAEENEAAVAEMKAWRRALRGEDLMEPPADEMGGDPSVTFMSGEPTAVREPGGDAAGRNADGSIRTQGSRDGSDVHTGVARGTADGGEDQSRSSTASQSSSPPSAEQLLKRMTGSLERMNSSLTPELLKEFDELPGSQRDAFLDAVDALTESVGVLR